MDYCRLTIMSSEIWNTASNEVPQAEETDCYLTHQCGHPCHNWLKISRTEASVLSDHVYAVNRYREASVLSDHVYAVNRYRTVGTITEELSTFMTPTPNKTFPNRTEEMSFVKICHSPMMIVKITVKIQHSMKMLLQIILTSLTLRRMTMKHNLTSTHGL